MNKKVIIDYFGSVQNVADLLGTSHAAVSKWPDELSDRIFHRVVGAATDKGIPFPQEWVGKSNAA
ncbi:Cro/CI family transcriptional regulator [Thiomicrorhabdus lithotrophica]|uniref:Cro/CI family transcriptional regulator n=1 Tax=Thiomicrorhabdus lithotrophica TaxID=2949997 RepID=A0ABY8CCQ3_9GAMM|nr:Cro/CI family transcriptional regulator [Thiomicrorhabdus lithotrophica]WEJ62173.1 Cro/CI family transcriptional regulator [Thiomicrorhabdus lithotrophica]